MRRRAGRGRLTPGRRAIEVSILFQISRITRMSATMEPDDVLDINAYFAALVEAIFRCEGRWTN